MSKDNSLPARSLGSSGLQVSAIGLGCMSLSGVYGKSGDEEGIALIREALDRGITFLDTSDAYGAGHNEQLVDKAIAGRRSGVVLATKFGNIGGRDGKFADGRPEFVIASCEASLKRLGVEVIDLYYQHRIDPSVPIEDTVGAMARLVEQGKVRALGLSEASPKTIRRAHAVHVIAVQMAYVDSVEVSMIEPQLVQSVPRVSTGVNQHALTIHFKQHVALEIFQCEGRTDTNKLQFHL